MNDDFDLIQWITTNEAAVLSASTQNIPKNKSPRQVGGIIVCARFLSYPSVSARATSGSSSHGRGKVRK
jgi:hypothetical protein